MGLNTVTVTVAPPSGSYDGSTITNGITFGGTISLPTLPSLGFKSGTGAGKANLISKLYLGTLTATSTVFDLTSLLDAQGNALNLVRPKGVVVYNLPTIPSAVGGDLLLGGNGTTPWIAPFNGITTVCGIAKAGYLDANNYQYPGIWQAWAPDATGFGLTGTAKNFKVDAGAATINYAIFFVGCDA